MLQYLRNARNIIDVITQRDEQIKKQLTPTGHHLHLHRATSLERASTADDESEIMSSKFRVIIGSVGVSIASGSQDGAALNSGFYKR
jgi:hypothetical protein